MGSGVEPLAMATRSHKAGLGRLEWVRGVGFVGPGWYRSAGAGIVLPARCAVVVRSSAAGLSSLALRAAVGLAFGVLRPGWYRPAGAPGLFYRPVAP